MYITRLLKQIKKEDENGAGVASLELLEMYVGMSDHAFVVGSVLILFFHLNVSGTEGPEMTQQSLG